LPEFRHINNNAIEIVSPTMTQNATPVKESVEFEAEISELEREIADLRHRHLDIELAEREQVVLQRQRHELKQKGHKYPEVKQELAQIRSRLAELDLILESKLLNLWEPFWQAVRFGGLGVVIGWLLCSWHN
jgi:chorismate mutase